MLKPKTVIIDGIEYNLVPANQEKPTILYVPAKKLEWMESNGKTHTWYGATKLETNGWRLPTRIELLQLYESGLMPGESVYWSASWYASNNGSAWLVYFSNGAVSTGSKNNSYPVRLVREIKD